MNKRIKDLWLQALRSGEYEQTTGSLCEAEEDGTKRYCCLGVLCDLAAKEGIGEWREIIHAEKGFMGVYGFTPTGSEWYSEEDLPWDVVEWAGLPLASPRAWDEDGISFPTLITMNDDRGMTFREIADAIERGVEGE